MPQLLLMVLAGAGIYAGYNWYRKEQERVRAALEEAEAELRRREEIAMPKLKRNPETGVYEPANRD